MNNLSRDWPYYYVQLALVKEGKVTRAEKDLQEIEERTLRGQIDEIFCKKDRIDGLEDIFQKQNDRCPRLILVMGGPGILCKTNN